MFAMSFLNVTFSLLLLKWLTDIGLQFPLIFRTMSHTFLTDVRKLSFETYCCQDFRFDCHIVRRAFARNSRKLFRSSCEGRVKMP